MGQIIFIEHDGSEHIVDLEAGKSLMQLAVNNGVPSIDGDCGGECACGTCHVILENKTETFLGRSRIYSVINPRIKSMMENT